MLSQPEAPRGGLLRWLPAVLACVLAAWSGAAEDAAQGERSDTGQAAKAEPAKSRNDAVGETRKPPQTVATRPSGPPPEFRGPDVTLIASEERTVYEFRQNGQLRMIKVVPKFGKPYYLAPRDPTTGFGDLEQADSLIAEWVLWEF